MRGLRILYTTGLYLCSLFLYYQKYLFVNILYNYLFMIEDGLTYQKAVAEMESILELLEKESLPVDELSEKVNRVAALLAFCRKKLLSTEEEVQKIIESIPQ